MKVANFYCYGAIGKNYISALKVSEFIGGLSTDVTDIVVHINSNGGDVFEGLAIHDLLTGSGKKITTIAEGLCASIATIVFLSGSVREITPNSQLMVHSPWISPNDDESYTANDLLEMGTDLKVIEDQMNTFYQNKTGLDKATVSGLMGKDSFITADKALELKFATTITQPIKAMAFIPENLLTKKTEMNFKKIMADALRTAAAKMDAPKMEMNTTSDGVVIYSADALASGVPVFSDELMSMPMADGSYLMEDGSTVVVSGGLVSEVQAKVETPAAPAAAPVASLEEQLAALTIENAELKAKVQATLAERESDNTTALNAVNALTKKIAEIKSTYVPKVSGTQFKGTEVKEGLSDFQERLKKAKEGKK